MPIYIADVECFQVDGALVAKELAIINILAPLVECWHILLKPTRLPTRRKDKRTARYLTRFHHGLPLKSPEFEVSEVPNISIDSVIIMRGDDSKQKCIQSLYPDCLVLCLEVEKNSNCEHECKFYEHSLKHCAFSKAISLYYDMHL